MILYFGNNVVISEQKLLQQNRFLDLGFYTPQTKSRSQALQIEFTSAEKALSYFETLHTTEEKYIVEDIELVYRGKTDMT